MIYFALRGFLDMVRRGKICESKRSVSVLKLNTVGDRESYAFSIGYDALITMHYAMCCMAHCITEALILYFSTLL